jgi:hypothetical protein
MRRAVLTGAGALALTAAAPAVAQTPGLIPHTSDVTRAGIGKVTFGMTLQQAKDAAGVFLRQEKVGACTYLDAGPPGTPDGPFLRFHDGRFRQVEVGINDYRTHKHLGVGSPVRKVRHRYPHSRRVGNIGGGYRLIWPRTGRGRLVFVIGRGRVTNLISGQTPWVRDQEC